MSERTDDIIAAREAPLSHLSGPARRRTWREFLDWRSGVVAALVVAAVITAFVWQPQIQPTARSQPGTATPPSGTPAADAGQTDQLAPFAQAQQQRAREQAQAALAKFVEQQILLEDTMQVESWGAAELDAAMAMAQDGDAEFLAERFESSLAAYQNAAASLEEIVARGDMLFEQHLASGRSYIAALDTESAVDALTQALVIKPDSSDAAREMARAEQLPEIISMLRTAKNHELGGRYSEALAVYKRVQQLDPQTTGLGALQAGAAQAQAGDDLTSYISRGFTALEANRFEAAKRAFNQALALDPGNDIAKGGLQQVAEENDLAIIRRHQQAADEALQNENWQRAIDEYQAVLKLDGNIQFALNGSRAAQAHLRAQRLLEKISGEPQKLSSEKLYLDAVAIAADARSLEYAGPKTVQLRTEVERLLELYRDPVDVVLLSDNATNVVMSNVGQLGYFERKTLTLRPGQYTIRGSQNGCRDIFLSIEVLPGIAPLDLSCPETLNLNK